MKIKSEDACFHRFVFRENPSQPIHVYKLTAVTFGDKPSPTAAIVTLRHVAAEHAADDKEMNRVIAEFVTLSMIFFAVAHVLVCITNWTNYLLKLLLRSIHQSEKYIDRDDYIP